MASPWARRTPAQGEHAWAWAGVCGVGFVIWIVVQALMMGSFRHPIQTALQAAVLALGITVVAMAALQYLDWRRRAKQATT